MTLMQRFQAKIRERDDGCYEWIGYRTPDGYGRIQDGTSKMAHRVAWELLVAPIPTGLEIHHECRNRACVNVEHLRLVTHKQNLELDRDNIGAHMRARTHCPQGHPYDDTNTAFVSGRRVCRICRNAATRRHREKKLGRPLGLHGRDKTSCPQGHPYDEANTYRDKNGKRSCRKCRTAAAERWRERQKITSR